MTNARRRPLSLAAAMRDDSDGSRWQSLELALASLAPGDDVIELTGAALGAEARSANPASGAEARSAKAAERTLVAFRVVP